MSAATTQVAIFPTTSISDLDSMAELHQRWMSSVQLTTAKTHLERSQAYLAAAQDILAKECAPLLTGILISANSPPLPSTTSSQLVSFTKVATDFLDRAANELAATHNDDAIAPHGEEPAPSPSEEAASPRSEESDSSAATVADVMWQTRDRVSMLRAFAEIFAAFGKADGTSTSRMAIQDACNKLALYQNDDDHGIAESVRFWRAVAYRQARRPERALQLLRPILEIPEFRRLGFWARLERCRSLSDAGRHSAGIALCLRIKARVPKWFDGASVETYTKATDTVRFIHIELLRSWERALRDAGQNGRADQLASEVVKLRGPESFPPSPERWLGLVQSIAERPIE